MLLRLLPLMLLVGCLDVPTTSFDMLNPSAEKSTTSRSESLALLYRSTDQGATWSPIAENLSDKLFGTAMSPIGDRMILATGNKGLYLSDPTKQLWEKLPCEGLPNEKIMALNVSKGVIYVSCFWKGVYASHDMGQTWTSLNHDLGKRQVTAILRIGDQLLAGSDDGIFKLKDGATSWLPIFKTPQVNQLIQAESHLVAGTEGGIYISKDNGMTWDWVRKGVGILQLALDGSTITAYETGGFTEVSKDNGATWLPIENGQPFLGNLLDAIPTDGGLRRATSAEINISENDRSMESLFQTVKTETITIMAREGDVLYGCRFMGC